LVMAFTWELQSILQDYFESRQLVRIIMKYLRFGEKQYRERNFRIRVKCDSNMEYAYIKLAKDALKYMTTGRYSKNDQTCHALMIRLHATSGKYQIKRTRSDFKTAVEPAQFSTVRLRDDGRYDDEAWGFHLDLDAHWSSWTVKTVDPPSYVRIDWRVHKVENQVVRAGNYEEIKEFLKTRKACTIIFHTNPERRDSRFDIHDVVLDELVSWIRFDTNKYELQKASSIAWYDHFLLSSNTRHEIESWWDTESNFIALDRDEQGYFQPPEDAIAIENDRESDDDTY